jgi:hypothetical protein
MRVLHCPVCEFHASIHCIGTLRKYCLAGFGSPRVPESSPRHTNSQPPAFATVLPDAVGPTLPLTHHDSHSPLEPPQQSWHGENHDTTPKLPPIMSPILQHRNLRTRSDPFPTPRGQPLARSEVPLDGNHGFNGATVTPVKSLSARLPSSRTDRHKGPDGLPLAPVSPRPGRPDTPVKSHRTLYSGENGELMRPPLRPAGKRSDHRVSPRVAVRQILSPWKVVEGDDHSQDTVKDPSDSETASISAYVGESSGICSPNVLVRPTPPGMDDPWPVAFLPAGLSPIGPLNIPEMPVLVSPVLPLSSTDGSSPFFAASQSTALGQPIDGSDASFATTVFTLSP